MILKNRLFLCSFSILLLLSTVSCNETSSKRTSTNNNTYQLNEIAETGSYTNVKEDMNDNIQIFDNGTLQFMDFDINEMSDFYSDAFKELGIAREEFQRMYNTPYNVEVTDGEAEGAYKIYVPILGEESGVRFILNYDNSNKTIFYHSNTYKLQTENDINGSN